MNKAKFGLFIKENRLNKGYTQKQLADILFLDVTAISKWERGISFPDITMIPEICKALDVSEHELIESTKDEEYRKIKKQALQYQKQKDIIFYVSSIIYTLAILICFIVNIAVEKKLSWFFIVLSSCITGYTFCPTITRFFIKYKLSVFIISTLTSLFLLYLTCSIYTNNYWFFIAFTSTLLGYFIIFFPFLFIKQNSYMYDELYNKIKKYYILSYATGILIFTTFLLLSINMYKSFQVGKSLIILLYSILILFIIGLVNILKINHSLKTGIILILSSVYLFFLGPVLTKLIEGTKYNLTINFKDWNNYSNGNTTFILCGITLVIGIIFISLSILNKTKKKK